MSFKLIIIIFILFLTDTTHSFSQTGAGNIPVPKGMNKTSLSKPALPNREPKSLPLKEIQEINRLKSSYDSLSSQIKELKNLAKDSVTYDSMFVELKVKGVELVDREMDVLEVLKNSESSGSSDISGAISYRQRNVSASKESMAQAKDLGSLGDIVQTNEQNLKALVNEYVMPNLETTVWGMESVTSAAGKPKILDYYSKGGLVALSQGADISTVRGKLEGVKSLTPEVLKAYGKDFSKIELLEDGSVRVIPQVKEVKKKAFFEPNTFKGTSFLHRIGAGLTYNAIEAFSDGVNATLYASYAFSHQLEIHSGINFKRQYGKTHLVTREGQGLHATMRFTKEQWFLQSTIEYNSITVSYANKQADRDFDGHVVNGLIGLGRKVEILPKVNGIFLGLFDPTFTDNKRLHKSQFMLRMGFEIGAKGKINYQKFL